MPSLGAFFWYEAQLARQPGPPRPDVQVYARQMQQIADRQKQPEPATAIPLPGRGVSGESTN